MPVKLYPRHEFLTWRQTTKPTEGLLARLVSCWKRLLNSLHHEFFDENDLHQSLPGKIATNGGVMDCMIFFGRVTGVEVVPLPPLHGEWLQCYSGDEALWGCRCRHPQRCGVWTGPCWGKSATLPSYFKLEDIIDSRPILACKFAKNFS